MDDHAAVARQHEAQRGEHAVDVAEVGDLGRASDLRGVGIPDGREDGCHRIVDPDVDGAELPLDLVRRGVYLSRIGDVHTDRQGSATAGTANIGNGGLQTRSGTSDQGDVVAALRECDGRGSADAKRGSGHDDDSAAHLAPVPGGPQRKRKHDGAGLTGRPRRVPMRMPTDNHSDEEPGYAALSGTFVLGTGAALLGLARTGRLPERVAVGDIALLGVATYQVSRTLTRDRVTTFLREPFARQQGPAGRGEVRSEPRGHGFRRAVGELFVCPFCMTQWVGAAFLAALCVAPRATRFTAGMLAVRTVSELANLGHEAAVAEIDRLQKRSESSSERAAA